MEDVAEHFWISASNDAKTFDSLRQLMRLFVFLLQLMRILVFCFNWCKHFYVNCCKKNYVLDDAEVYLLLQLCPKFLFSVSLNTKFVYMKTDVGEKCESSWPARNNEITPAFVYNKSAQETATNTEKIIILNWKKWASGMSLSNDVMLLQIFILYIVHSFETCKSAFSNTLFWQKIKNRKQDVHGA